MIKILKSLALLLAITVAAAGFVPAVAYGNTAKQYSEEIIEFNLQKSSADSVQEWIDGDLSRDAGVGSEWYIIALSNYGKYDFSNYNTALNSYLSENEVGSASSRLKYALTYIAIGDEKNPYINKILDDSIGEQGIMSLVFGLHLLNNGCKCDAYSVNGLVDELLSLQLSDGGWAVMGEYGDVDVTAMTVQALAAYYNSNPDVRSSVDDALDFLSARQLENGGYSAYGVENPESASQVIIALSSLGTDACADSRFIKNGNTVFDGMSSFCLPDGSFCHREGGTSDSTATAQVLCASVAYGNMKNAKSPFYIFDDFKIGSQEKTTNAIITETTAITSAVEDSSEFTNAATTNATVPLKTEPLQTQSDKTDSVWLIFVCVVATLVCTVFFIIKKRRITVIVLVAAIAVIVLIAGISDNNADKIGFVTISISCETIKDKDKSYIPENGIILEKTKVEIENGDTVYDVFSEICKEEGILFSSDMGYIEGINNIFETDFGKSSGWIYFVNGEAPSVGCVSYKLSDGDEIEWHYTREMGKDLDIDF